MTPLSKQLILGIDPGSRITGFGIIACENKHISYIASGCIKITGNTLADRLQQIHVDLTAIIQQYRPDLATIEDVFVHKNIKSALRLGEARGTAIATVGQYGIPLTSYATRKIKQTVVGYGDASKQQVQNMVQRLLKLSGLPQADAADALAVALCHAQHGRFQDYREISSG